MEASATDESELRDYSSVNERHLNQYKYFETSNPCDFAYGAMLISTE